MIATAQGRQRPRAVQNPAYRLVRHFINLLTENVKKGDNKLDGVQTKTARRYFGFI
jgi:hypothetical protein